MFKKELATIHLYQKVVVENETKDVQPEIIQLCADGLTKGLLIHPAVLMSNQQPKAFYQTMVQELSVNVDQINSTFFKNFDDVRNTPEMIRCYYQLLHYASTYGNAMFAFDVPFIPNTFTNDELESLQLTFSSLKKILPTTVNELEQMVQQTVSSGMALSDEQLNDLIKIVKEYSLNLSVDNIKNKEFACIYSMETGILPKEPEQMLRYLVYLFTGQTLLIKNYELFHKIKYSEQPIYHIYEALQKYSQTYDGEKQFARIFYRYKPLFLAIRQWFKLHESNYHSNLNYLQTKSKTRNGVFVDLSLYDEQKELIEKRNQAIAGMKAINRIRRLAKTYHEPMKTIHVGNLMNHLDSVSIEEIRHLLKQANNYQLVKLYNAVSNKISLNHFYANENYLKLYHIRNGRDYLKTHTQPTWNEQYYQQLHQLYSEILAELKLKGKHLNNQNVLLPKHVHYMMPTSAKTFTGNLPYGTTIELGEEAMIGIVWRNEADLDLSATYKNGQNISWFEQWHDENVVYTGDMTALNEHGFAAEFIAIKAAEQLDEIILSVNPYYTPNGKTPFQLIIGKAKTKMTNIRQTNFENNQRISDIIDIQYVVPFDGCQNQSLGYIERGQAFDGSNRLLFHVANVSNLGKQVVASAEKMLEGLMNNQYGQLSVQNWLKLVDATICYDDEPIVDTRHIIDLRLEQFSMQTLLDLMEGKVSETA